MCRNYRVQQEVIELAKAHADNVWAVYEDDGCGATNLTTIITETMERIGGTFCNVARSFHVYRYGDIESEKTIVGFYADDDRTIRRAFDVDGRYATLQAC